MITRSFLALVLCFAGRAAIAQQTDSPTSGKIAMSKAADYLREGHLAVHLLGTNSEGGNCEILIADDYMAANYQDADGRVVGDGVYNPYWAMMETGSQVASDKKEVAGEEHMYVNVLSTIDKSSAFFSTTQSLKDAKGNKLARPEFKSGILIFTRGQSTQDCTLKIKLFDDRPVHNSLLPGAVFPKQ